MYRHESEAMRNPENPLPKCKFCGLDLTVSMVCHRAGREDWPRWTLCCCFCGATGPTAETPELAEAFYRDGYSRQISWEFRDGPAQCPHGPLEAECCQRCIDEYRSATSG